MITTINKNEEVTATITMHVDTLKYIRKILLHKSQQIIAEEGCKVDSPVHGVLAVLDDLM